MQKTSQEQLILLSKEQLTGRFVVALGVIHVQAVVVTAVEGATDKLIKSIALAQNKDMQYKDVIEEIVAEHSKLLIALFSSDAIPYLTRLSEEKAELLALLYAVYLSR